MTRSRSAGTNWLVRRDGGSGGVRHVLEGDGDRIRVGEDERSGQQEVRDAAERIQIGARIDFRLARATSGAMYSGVPTVTPSTVRLRSLGRAQRLSRGRSRAP